MFTRQSPLLFPSISWFHTRTSLYDVLSPNTHWASSKRGFTTIVCPRPMCSGARSTTNTVLAMRKLSRDCVLKGIHGSVLFAIDPYSYLRNVCWIRKDITYNRLFEPTSPKLYYISCCISVASSNAGVFGTFYCLRAQCFL